MRQISKSLITKTAQPLWVGYLNLQTKKGEDEKNLNENEDELDRGFNINDQGDFVASLGGLSISDTRIDLALEQMGMQLGV